MGRKIISWNLKKGVMNVKLGRQSKKISKFIFRNACVVRHPKELNALVFDMEMEYKIFYKKNKR